MKRKNYCYDLESKENSSSENVELTYTPTNLYAVKIQKAYNVEGYGDAVLFGTDGKIYSVTDGYFTTLYDEELNSVPEVICVSYKTKACLAVFTQDENIILADSAIKFTAPQADSHCFFDNKLFCVKERTVYYSKSFDIDVFEGDNFILPPTFGNAVKLCRANECVIIGCERGAWKLGVKDGEYSVENFTADILSETLVSCMGGAVYLSNGGVAYTDGKTIKKNKFPVDLTLDGTLGYHGGKCYVGCVKKDGTHCVFVYDFTTEKTAFINVNAKSIGGKVCVTDSGIATFNGSEVEKEEKSVLTYRFEKQTFGGGKMKKICAVFYTGKGEFSLTINSEKGNCVVNGKDSKTAYCRIDGRVFDIELTASVNSKSLEIFYYETGGGL